MASGTIDIARVEALWTRPATTMEARDGRVVARGKRVYLRTLTAADELSLPEWIGHWRVRERELFA